MAAPDREFLCKIKKFRANSTRCDKTVAGFRLCEGRRESRLIPVPADTRNPVLSSKVSQAFILIVARYWHVNSGPRYHLAANVHMKAAPPRYPNPGDGMLATVPYRIWFKFRFKSLFLK